VDDKLSVKIVADVSDLKKGLDQGKKSLKGFGAEGKKASDNINRLKGTSTGALGAIKKFRADIGAAQYAVAAFAAGLALLTKAQIDHANELKRWSANLQISTQSFSELSAVAARFGASSDDVGDSIKDLNERIADAASGNKTYQEAIARTGLSYRDLINLSPEDQFLRVSEAIGKMTDAGKANFATADLMADAGFRLLDMFRQGPEAISAMRQEVVMTGEAMSGSTVENFNALGKSFNKLWASTGAVITRFGDSIAPTAISMTDGLNKAMKNFNTTMFDTEKVTKDVNVAVESMGVAFNKITLRAQTAMFTTLTDRLQGAKNTVTELRGILGSSFSEQHVLVKPLIARIEKLSEALAQVGNKGESIKNISDALKEANNVPEVSNEFQSTEMLGPQLPSTEDDAMMIMEQMRTDFLAEQLEERVRLNSEYINSIGKDQYDFNAALRQQEVDQQQATRMIWESGWKGKADILGDIMGNMSSLMNSESRKMFEIGKAAATASAIIETISAAQKAFSAMALITGVGPALGAAAAAAAMLSGMARVQQIQATTFGSKSVGGGAGGGVAGTPQPQDVINTTNVDISLQGDRFGGDSVRSMLGAINSAIADGGKIGAINVR
jgi:hypothetical protein